MCTIVVSQLTFVQQFVDVSMHFISALFSAVYPGMHLCEAALKEYLPCGKSAAYLKTTLWINLLLHCVSRMSVACCEFLLSLFESYKFFKVTVSLVGCP